MPTVTKIHMKMSSDTFCPASPTDNRNTDIFQGGELASKGPAPCSPLNEKPWTIGQCHYIFHPLCSLQLDTYNISILIINVIFNALWSHPPNGDPLLTPSFTLITTKIVAGIHVFCHPKVSYLDYSVLVNPVIELTVSVVLFKYPF